MLLQLLHASTSPAPRASPLITCGGEALSWRDDAYKRALVASDPPFFRSSLAAASARGWAPGLELRASPGGAEARFSISPSSLPHSSALMATLPSSPVNRLSLLAKLDSLTSALARLRSSPSFPLYLSLKRRLPPPSNPLRLCACLLPVYTDPAGRQYLVLTRRRSRTGKAATFSSMWVFPGGHVDPSELPPAAALRECLEETGLRCGEPRPLCTYQATLAGKRRGYLLAFHAARVKGPPLPAAELLKNVDPEEVAAACLVPAEFLEALAPRKISGGTHAQALEVAGRAEFAGGFEGVRVDGSGAAVPATGS
ncbi:hypothetical protein TeGR_g532 [Tetraparma gracilis]|uniref:Nudix hydrolase domain-containing protein n=1 Tax=Tetraparma gracilis TaxID=2962635 RepID=A0ABQ6N2K0_9STRA|nr:hypothetical protein TeGR_g532 [Tetraparma gracilis]